MPSENNLSASMELKKDLQAGQDLRLEEMKPNSLSSERWKQLGLAEKFTYALFGKKVTAEEALAIYKKECALEEDKYFNKLQLIVSRDKVEDYARYQQEIATIRYKVSALGNQFALELFRATQKIKLYFNMLEKETLDMIEDSLKKGLITNQGAEEMQEELRPELKQFISDAIHEMEILRKQKIFEFKAAIENQNTI